MNTKDMKKVLKDFSEDDIEFDDPHVELRCKENNITKERVIGILLYEINKLTNIIVDRQESTSFILN